MGRGRGKTKKQKRKRFQIEFGLRIWRSGGGAVFPCNKTSSTAKKIVVGSLAGTVSPERHDQKDDQVRFERRYGFALSSLPTPFSLSPPLFALDAALSVLAVAGLLSNDRQTGVKGGKTSAVQFLESHLRENGYIVITVPNALSMLVSSGVVEPSPQSSKESLQLFATSLLKHQFNLEDTFCTLAKVEAPILGGPDDDVLILYDCGALDIKSRVTPESWEAALRAVGMTEASVLRRYDVVFHLESTLKEAPLSPSGRAKESRAESGTDDFGQDNSVSQCWRAHPHHYTVLNKPETPTFEQKMADLLGAFSTYASATKHLHCDRA